MTSHTDPIRHQTPLCAQCHQREALPRINPYSHSRSRRAKSGGKFRLKDHDLCRVCWRKLSAPTWVHGHV